MKLGGLQKLTLLDFPEKMACTVFTEGCNLRCPFCHNASLVVNLGQFEETKEEEVFALLAKRKGVLDGVAITGGEPLLHRDIDVFIDRIKALGFAVKLDTNGTFPDRLKNLIDTGRVDYVAVDIKNSPERYAETVGIKDFDVAPVRETVEILKNGKVDYEFRTTVVKPLFDKAAFEAIGKWISGAKKYFLQKFKDSGELIAADGLSGYTDEEMQEFLGVVKKYVPNAEIRG